MWFVATLWHHRWRRVWRGGVRSCIAAGALLLVVVTVAFFVRWSESRVQGRHARPPGALALYLGGGAWSEPSGFSMPEQGVVAARVVTLVHGLDEPGGIWDELVPVLDAAGYTVLRFDYPNDARIQRAASGLSKALMALGVAQGVREVSLVGHSMGGLVARSALLEGGPKGVVVPRLITVCTPHEGSYWAHLRELGEVRDAVVAMVQDPSLGFVEAIMLDGDGGAGKDLLPGSAFLERLGAAPLPQETRVTHIVATPLGPEVSALLAGTARGAVLDALGDGVVTPQSAAPQGAEDVVWVRGTHRTVLVRMTPLDPAPAAVSVILDRLGRDRAVRPPVHGRRPVPVSDSVVGPVPSPAPAPATAPVPAA